MTVKKGDKIRIVDEDAVMFDEYKRGDIFTVSSVDSDGDVYVHGVNQVIVAKEFEVISDDGKFAEGDRVEITVDCLHKGRELTLRKRRYDKDDEGDGKAWNVEELPGWIGEYDFRLKERAQKNQTVADFAEGDRVQLNVTGSTPEYSWGSVSNGDIGTVAVVNIGKLYVDFPKQSFWTALPTELKILSKAEESEGAEESKQEPSKPSEPAVKVGDKIRITDSFSFGGDYEEGDILTVSQLVGSRGVRVSEVSEAIANEEFEVMKGFDDITVGDHVKVLGRSVIRHHFNIGEVVEVVNTYAGSNSIDCKRLNSESTLHQTLDRADVKKVEVKTDYKTGDKVRLLSGGGLFPLNGFTDGEIYEVAQNGNTGTGELRIIRDGFPSQGFPMFDQVEKVEQTAADNFRVGDIVLNSHGKLDEVVAIKEQVVIDSNKGITLKDDLWIYADDVTLVARAKDRVDVG